MKFQLPRSKTLSVPIVFLAAVGALAAVALGSPGGGGFAPETPLVTANSASSLHLSNDGVSLQTSGPLDVRVQKIVLGPGAFSGWHHHPGLVIASVASGAVTFTMNCSSTTYGPGLPAGSVFAEDTKTPGQASSVGGAIVYVTYLAPHAVPPVFRFEDNVPAPCNRTVPGVTVPGVTVPGVTVPGVTVPGVTVPGVTTPSVTTSGVTTSSVTTSSVTTSGVATSSVEVPGVTVRSADSSGSAAASVHVGH
jgi:hypothetical protein